MKRLRLPGGVSWFMLIWLSCVIIPNAQGKMRLNLLVALTSWTYGVLGIDLALGLWARQTYWSYWDPWQLLGAGLTAVIFCLSGLLVGAFAGQSCYLVVADRDETPVLAPSQDAYPIDPRQNSEKILLPPRERSKTVHRPVLWRVVVLLAFSTLVGIGSGGGLARAVSMPRMAVASNQVKEEAVPDWVPVPAGGGFEVDMPGRPERVGDWMVFECAYGRFGLSALPLSQDQAAWRWQLWGGMLASVGPCTALRNCQQSGLEGIEFRSGDLTTRLLVGPERVYSLCALTPDGDWRGAAFLNSFRLVPK